MKSKFFILALSALSVVACQTDSPFGFENDPAAVRLNVGMNGMLTRTNPAINNSDNFNKGDKISVSAGSQPAVTYIFDETNWNPVSGYLKWEAETMLFKAVYPSDATFTDFTLPPNQSEKIENADYMTYQGSFTRNSSINLPMERKTARVIVKITEFAEPYESTSIVNNLKISSGAASYSGGVPSGGVTPITPLVVGNGGVGSTYTALVIPTEGNTQANFIELTDQDGTTLCVKKIPPLEAKKSYTYDLKINKKNVEINSVEVEPWGAEEEVTPGGSAEGLTIKYEKIAGGTFQMGTAGTDAKPDEQPQHPVTLSSFKMSKYEITNYQYCVFLNACKVLENGLWPLPEPALYKGQKLIYDSSQEGRSDWGVNYTNGKWVPAPNYDNFPVIYVTWYGAKAFAQWVGGDLPTEAQWEYACRGKTTTPWWFGSSPENLKDYAWYSGNSGSHTHAVGTTKGTNKVHPYGLYDMYGNVLEWCNDWYNKDYYTTESAKGKDPTGPLDGSNRVLRGGACYNDASNCRSAYRNGNGNPVSYYDGLGFRVVVSVVP